MLEHPVHEHESTIHTFKKTASSAQSGVQICKKLLRTLLHKSTWHQRKKNVIFGGCSYESVFINDDVFTWENFTVLWNAAFELLASHPQVSLLDSVIVFSFSHHDWVFSATTKNLKKQQLKVF